jgi:predicted dehydrogenase
MPDVELVGIVDVDTTRAAALAKQLNTTAYSDYRDLFGRVEAVSVVVPTPLHYPVSKAFLERNIDVMIEKPITTTLAEADELIRISRQRAAIIQVGHLERFNPAVAALREVANGPRFIEAHRLSIFKPRCIDVNVVLDLMIHDLDIILSFVPSGIRRIHAAGIAVICDSADIANARIEFENGCVANVTASRVSLRNERKIRMFQQDGCFSVDFANRQISEIRPSETDADAGIPAMAIKQRTFAGSDALDDELKSFVRSVRHRKPPEVTGVMGRDALAMALQISEQIAAGNDRTGGR